MKKIIFIIALCPILAFSQEKPQKVVSIIQEEHNIDWYKNQAKLWKAELKKNPKNENGWLYYYTACRMVWVLNGWKDSDRAEINEILKTIAQKIPDTFIYNYINAYDIGSMKPEESYSFLNKAYEIQPDNVMLFDKLVSRFEIKQNLEKRKEINTKWFQSGTYSTGILNYNYNVLSSLAPNAILFTFGDNDTYPVLMIQDALNYRTDVVCINTSLAKIGAYRNEIFKKLAIVLSEPELKLMNDIDSDKWEENFVKLFVSKYKSNPIYFALTAGNRDYLKSLESDIYIIGLASLYSEKKVDNLAMLRDNFENNYLLDYLQMPLYNETAKTIVPYFDQNYIAPLIMLYNHYKISGEYAKSIKTKTILEKIAKENNRLDEVNNLIK